LAVKKDSGQKSLADVLAELNKKHDIVIGSLEEVSDPVVEVISTGNLAIDEISGVGGFPVGRMVELLGPPASGKTSTGIQAAAEIQRRIIAEGTDECVLYLDFEHALDLEYAKNLGLDTAHESFMFAQPDSLEQGCEVASKMLETGAVRFMLFDSVAAMVPQAEIDGDLEQVQVALQARLLSKFLRGIVPQLPKFDCLAVFINHEKEVIDMGGRGGPVKKYVSPGGVALKFYASMRMQFRQREQVKVPRLNPLTNAVEDVVEGHMVGVKVLKNKVGPAFREAVVRTRAGKGFDNGHTALMVLVAHKVIVKGGSFFYFDKESASLARDWMKSSATGRPQIQGERAVVSRMDEHPDWRRAIIEMAVELVKKAGSGITQQGEEEFDEDEPVVGKAKGKKINGNVSLTDL